MSTVSQSQRPTLTAASIRALKAKTDRQKLVVVTAYDYTFARLVDELVDVVLVGDSLGMVVKGEPNTLSVSMDEMIYHTRAVARGLKRAHLVADMPFLSYQASLEDGVRNAGRLLAEGGAHAVKVEGGVSVAPLVARLSEIGIPVLGHIGLTPQSVHAFGGYRVQGKTPTSQESIFADAIALEEAGAYAVVLEGIPADLASRITERLKIPTIGIGAGRDCDGQVLVIQDLLGLNIDFQPRFVKRFANLDSVVKESISRYRDEVQGGTFPGEEQSFK